MQPGGQARLQFRQESDPDQNAVDIVAENELADIGWQYVLQDQDETGRMPHSSMRTLQSGGCRNGSTW